MPEYVVEFTCAKRKPNGRYHLIEIEATGWDIAYSSAFQQLKQQHQRIEIVGVIHKKTGKQYLDFETISALRAQPSLKT